MLRYINWHIPTPGAPLPQFYIDADSEPIGLRIHADTASSGNDFTVDILDDGVSIMKPNNSQAWSYKDEPGYIEFGTHSGTFTVNETITGGSSAATAKVSKNQFGRVTLYDVSGIFTVGETITGGSSSATATIDAYVRPVKNSTRDTSVNQSVAGLPKGATSEDMAGNFAEGTVIREGSWLSLSVLKAGANNVSVQLELVALSAGEDTRRAQ